MIILLLVLMCLSLPGSISDYACNRSYSYYEQMGNWEVPAKEWDRRIRGDTNRFFRPYLNNINEQDVRKYVYIDLGARKPSSSIGFFTRNYPLMKNKDFDIYAFEADKRYYKPLRAANFGRHKIVEVIRKAVWTTNGTVTFGGKMGAILSDTSSRKASDLSSTESTHVISVPSLDFDEWLQNHVTKEDFVALKMDIEGAEYSILPKLFESGSLNLIDELFVEIHFNRFQMSRPGRQDRPHNWDHVQSLGRDMAKCVYYHLWF